MVSKICRACHIVLTTSATIPHSQSPDVWMTTGDGNTGWTMASVGRSELVAASFTQPL